MPCRFQPVQEPERLIVSFAASQEDSKWATYGMSYAMKYKPSEMNIIEHLDILLKSAFQEVYEECSEKGNVILKEAAAELEIQTDQARQDLRAVLSVGGFLDFMITGGISAIRFGVILGGILLALSVSSLRSWRRGEATNMTLKGQKGTDICGASQNSCQVFITLLPIMSGSMHSS
ncbi:hypothetical protein Cgig2_010466 [Carnegiea gigantea]|uniref:Uncharacterized protein n=1 Tax=Carnegiea gigantea TaxID=171969 RepID=A0A9Q1K0K1_9CARY|nr:hypothetical protein Cgig2_010466 [Carnegiea gigantea]